MSNNVCYLILPGYFQVAYASEILKKRNLPSVITRAPVCMGKGCRYAIETDETVYRKCLAVLKEERVMVEEVLCTNK